MIDNFIKEEDADIIERTFNDPSFPWYYQTNTVIVLGNKDYTLDGYCTTSFLRHSFYMNYSVNSSYSGLIKPLLENISNLFDKDIIFSSASSNLLIPNTKNIGKLCIPHIDINYDSETASKYNTYTGLYYVHDCDGDTVLYKEKHDGGEILTDTVFNEERRITPKKNRFCYWDSKQYHSAPASASDTRFVINFNFIVEK